MATKGHVVVSVRPEMRVRADAIREKLGRIRGTPPSLAAFISEAVKRYEDVGVYNWTLIDLKKHQHEAATGDEMTHEEFVRHILDWYEKETSDGLLCWKEKSWEEKSWEER